MATADRTATIDVTTGDFRLFSDAPPVRPRMGIAEFGESYGHCGIHAFPGMPNLSPGGFSMVPLTVIGVSFRVDCFFADDQLSCISLIHIVLPPRPRSLPGRLRYEWKLFRGTLIPLRSEADEREWHTNVKRIHEQWIEDVLETTAPLREWPNWGRIQSFDTQGPMSPRILIEYY